MDNETWFIFPISGTLIGIVVLLPILCILVGADSAFNFIYGNYTVFFSIFSIISIILILIPLIGGIHLASILSFPAGAICSSQMLYMFHFGLNAIGNINDYGFALIGRTLLFIIWLIYMLINIIATFGSMGIGAFFSFGYKSIKNSTADTGELYSNLGISVGISTLFGVIGWIINWFFL